MAHDHSKIDGELGANRQTTAATFDHGRLARPAQRRWRPAAWLHALLLALAPLLVIGFYDVVNGAVERGAARQSVPPPNAQAARLQPVIWECSAQRGAALHNACRAVPVGASTVRPSVAGS